ncbi:MAG: hypothetical protein ACR2PS_14405 [Pseudomonadales bacterium]
MAAATDFYTGLLIGDLLSEDTANERKASQEPGTVVHFDNEGGEAVVAKTVVYKAGQWRQLEKANSEYFVCSGEYRRNAGGRCRVRDTGLNGLMGGYRDAKEVSLIQALEKSVGYHVKLQMIEHRGDDLIVKFAVKNKPTAAKSYVTQRLGKEQRSDDAVNGTTEQVTEGSGGRAKVVENRENANTRRHAPSFDTPFPSTLETTVDLLDSGLFKVIILSLLIVGVGIGIVTQNPIHIASATAPALFVWSAPTIIEAFIPVPEQANVSTTSGDGTLVFWVFIFVVITCVILIGAKFCSEIDERRINERRSNPSELADLDTLRSRQERIVEHAEEMPRVVARKTADSEGVITKNKRKLAID